MKPAAAKNKLLLKDSNVILLANIFCTFGIYQTESKKLGEKWGAFIVKHFCKYFKQKLYTQFKNFFLQLNDKDKKEQTKK